MLLPGGCILRPEAGTEKNGSDKKASPRNMIIETKNKSISYGSMGLSFLYVTTANKP